MFEGLLIMHNALGGGMG